MAEYAGRRRPDTPQTALPEDIQPGDYWKLLDSDGAPFDTPWPGKLTAGDWMIVQPNVEAGYGIGALRHHTVREEEDGTISVRPGDGSSNSIAIAGAAGRPGFHGYIERGVWRDA